MKQTLDVPEAKRQEDLKEARRIFVDTDGISEFALVGGYRLMCDIFDGEVLPDNCATFVGLDHVLENIHEVDIVYAHYFERMSFVKISAVYPCLGNPTTVRLAHKRGLKELRSQARKYFFPERKKYIERYAAFIDAVTSGCPSKNDLSIRELGLSTRASNALYHFGVTTASKMYFLSVEELLKTRNFGESALEEVIQLKADLLAGNI